jgi:hypothetical protein
MRWPARQARELFVADSVGLEDQLRFRLYTMFVALALPPMLVFGVQGIAQGNWVMASLVLASGFGLVAGWRLARRGRSVVIVYRANGFVFALLVLDMLIVGGEGGSKSQWINVYPLIMFFLLGEREGAVWAGGLLAASLAVLFAAPWFPGVYAYSADFAIRLAVVYTVVACATFGYEHSRRRYRDHLILERERLETEKQRLNQEISERERAEREKERLIHELQEALAQVQTLKGLVPICSHCHRIRDDKGFWNRLESYLQAHAGAQFSHGICPTCMTTHYPDLAEPDDPS